LHAADKTRSTNQSIVTVISQLNYKKKTNHNFAAASTPEMEQYIFGQLARLSELKHCETTNKHANK